MILKMHAKRERTVTWWSPAAQMRPVLDSSSFVPVPMLPRRTCHHSDNSILDVRISCRVIGIFVFRKPLFIKETLPYSCMLHDYHVMYRVRYNQQFHVTAVGVGTCYPQIRGHYFTLILPPSGVSFVTNVPTAELTNVCNLCCWRDWDPDWSIGVITRLLAGRSGVWIPVGKDIRVFSKTVRTGSGAHIASYSIDTEVQCRDKTAGAWSNHSLHLVQRFKRSVTTTLLPSLPLSRGQWQPYIF
jgi:hypothetical protein